MAWYRRSKLGWDMFRNLALGSKHPSTSCLDVTGCKKKNSWLKYYAVTGAAATASAAYLSNLETIPYSERTHVILVPRQLEKAWANRIIQGIKKEHEGKVLPATHPTSVRVGLIAKNVIDALHRDLIRGGYDDKYLEHVNWEVLVVDDPGLDFSSSYGAGKIVLTTGYLKYLNSDAEIATIIGRLVACVVARHAAEKVTKCARFILLEVFLDLCFGKSAMCDRISSLFYYLPLCRKLELEADYIGLLLMASAGYDPRVAVTLMPKIATNYSYWDGFFKKHPSAKKRVLILSQAQDEAMKYFRKSLGEDII